MNIIRADGNSEIGMGHVMRCLSIADVMTKKTVFVTACEESRSFLEAKGYQTVLLPTDYRDMEAELPIWRHSLQDWIKAAGGDGEKPVILVDSYRMTDRYLTELRRMGAVACMDDMGTPYPVDLLINYNLYGTELDYPKGLRTLLGADYIPLRREFRGENSFRVRERVRNVLITTGGGDPCFAAAGFLDAFLKPTGQGEIDSMIFHVVSGPVNRFADELKARYGKNERVVIHENVKDMKGLMCECDVVLTAAGSTVYEVCALGVPMICFYFAENQRRGAECLAERTEIVNAGDYSLAGQETIERACAELSLQANDLVRRKRLSERERRLVDGRGAGRIAEALGAL